MDLEYPQENVSKKPAYAEISSKVNPDIKSEKKHYHH